MWSHNAAGDRLRRHKYPPDDGYNTARWTGVSSDIGASRGPRTIRAPPKLFSYFFTSTADKNITKSPAAFTMHVAMLHVLGREPGQPASAKAPLSVHDLLEGKLVV